MRTLSNWMGPLDTPTIGSGTEIPQTESIECRSLIGYATHSLLRDIVDTE